MQSFFVHAKQSGWIKSNMAAADHHLVAAGHRKYDACFSPFTG